MKQTARLLLATLLTAMVAGGSVSATAAESAAVQQDLANVKTSRQVMSSVWKRLPDSYTLQVVIDRSVYPWSAAVRDSLQSSAQNGNQPQHIPNWRPGDGMNPAARQAERDAAFIRDTIANLRGLDSAFSSGGSMPPADGKGRRVVVWLLKADGSQIPPATYTTEDGGRTSPARTDVSISYGFALTDGAQAVAAAIRIDDDFYIEKLQPLAAPVGQ